MLTFFLMNIVSFTSIIFLVIYSEELKNLGFFHTLFFVAILKYLSIKEFKILLNFLSFGK